MQQALAAADNVFFVHAPPAEPALTELQRCALASAAQQNPTRRVSLLAASLSCPDAEALAAVGVHVVRYSPLEAFQGTPRLYAWSHAATRPSAALLADALRLALLARFGGVCLDLGVLSYRPLDGLVNAIGMASPRHLSSILLAFERGHPFLAQAIEVLAGSSADAIAGTAVTAAQADWDSSGLVNRVWRTLLAHPLASNVTLCPVEELYPVLEHAWEAFFEPSELRDITLERLVYTWPTRVTARLRVISLEGTALGSLMAACCPALPAAAAGGTFGMVKAAAARPALYAWPLLLQPQCSLELSDREKTLWRAAPVAPLLTLEGGTFSVADGDGELALVTAHPFARNQHTRHCLRSSLNSPFPICI